jgi:hypothetical protein
VLLKPEPIQVINIQALPSTVNQQPSARL